MGPNIRATLLAATMLPLVSPSLAQSFTKMYAFGDSLTDCCFLGPSTNTDQPNWVDHLAPRIGVGYAPSPTTNLAVGGAQSGRNNTARSVEASLGIETGLRAQIDRFAAQGQSVGARDIAGIWIGTNDIWPSALGRPISILGSPITPPLGVRPAVADLSTYVAGNVREAIGALTNLGIRNVVLASPYDLGKSTIFGAQGDEGTVNLARQYSVAVRDQLAQLYTPGVNTYFLDTLTLLDRVQTNRALYGFDHVTSIDNCAAAGCAALPLEAQNRFVFSDTIHLTSGFNLLMSRYIANMINAREALPALGYLGEGSARLFSNSLFSRLDADRHSSGSRGAPAGSVPVGNGVSLFADLTYGGFNVDRSTSPNGLGGAAFDAGVTGVTAGLQYRAMPNLQFGMALNYQTSDTDVGQLSRTKVELDTVQAGLFASYTSPSLFVDAVVTYAAHSFDMDRPGVVDRLSASTDGRTFTAAGRVGYMFDLPGWQVGPVAQLSYANMRIDGYQERGDPLLTLGVREQNYETLTGGAGVQLRTTIALPNAKLSPFLNLTAEHDFLDGVRTIASFGTIAPALLIGTSGGHKGDALYGRVAGGVRLDFGGGLEGIIAGASTFGRSYGNEFSVNAGFAYRF